MTSPAVYCLSLQIRPTLQDDPENSGNDGGGNTSNQSAQTLSSSSITTSTIIKKAINNVEKDFCVENDNIDGNLQPTSVNNTNQQNQQQTKNTTGLQQQQSHSNIILVRSARAENGQIILQNSHELLNLLNDDDNKQIVLQHPRIKAINVSKNNCDNTTSSNNTILLQTPFRNGQLDGGTVLLQPTNVKKTILPEGSIILQQRLNKTTNLGTPIGGSNDVGTSTSNGGPFLLQTLKRLDKSQSILLLRNGRTSLPTTTLSLTSPITTKSGIGNRITKLNNNSNLNTNGIKKGNRNSSNFNGGNVTVSLDETEDKTSDGKIQQKATKLPLGTDGEPIKLPDNLESLPRADHFPIQRHRWNTNEEIAAILISFDKHCEWQSKEVKTRPKSGSLLLYSRKKVRYRRDGYCWKKRKDGKTTREDHMKLKVQGTECIYGCYVHSAILPTFHRRCYWLLQNPDIVLVHYLNVPYPDDNKMAVITPNLALWGDKKEWTKEELVSQLKPMFFSEDEPDATNDIELSTVETVETIVTQLMEKQRLARQAVLVKQLECGCPDSTCADGKICSHPMRRSSTSKSLNEKRQDNNNQVSSTTPNILIGSRLYSHWNDRRQREILTDLSQKSTDSQIHFQVIPQNQQQQHHITRYPNSSHSTHCTGIRPSNQIFTNPSNQGTDNNHQTNNNLNAMIINKSSSDSNNNSSAAATMTPNSCSSSNNQMTSHTNQQISLAISSDNNKLNSLSHNVGHQIHNHHRHQFSIQSSPLEQNHKQKQSHHHHHQAIIDSNIAVNPSGSTNLISNNSNNRIVTSGGSIATSVASTPPLVLNLSQFNSSRGGLLILNSQQQSFVCQQPQQQQQQQLHLQRKVCTPKDEYSVQSLEAQLVPKQEAIDSVSSTASDKNLDAVYNQIGYNTTNQNSNTSNPSREKNLVKELNDSLSFFNETLDLSQEDIQKTLSANMPMHNNGGRTETDDVIGSNINPMDFIDNVCDIGVNSPPNSCTVSNEQDPDDVFVNLDAFDMLVEFPELELDNKNTLLNQETNENINNSHDSTRITSFVQSTYNISDYSPEWAYPEGGIKVLVTGPWLTTSSYTVLFDSFPVPTTVVQNGVLRCFCPGHEVGPAILEVACNGYVISNSVIFEYKSPPNTETKCEGSTNDSLYKFTLLDRLSSIDEKMRIKTEPKDLPEETYLISQKNFEEKLVNYCHTLTNKTWKSLTPGGWTVGQRGMTLLHLASILGYSKLVCAMLSWRSENPNVILETEIDALSQDIDGYTPLMRACSRGHFDTVIILYKWNHNSLNIKNYLHQTSLQVAIGNGFQNISSELERLEKSAQNGQQFTQTSLGLDAYTTTTNPNNKTSSSYTYENSSSISSQNNNINNNNYKSIINNSNEFNNKVHKNYNNFIIEQTDIKESNETGSLFHKINKKSNNPIINKNNDYSNKKLDNENNNVSQCSSQSILNRSANLSNGHRSHDGVFLRPGAVSSCQSPPSIRLTKRASFDSGINEDIRSFSRYGNIIREQNNYYNFATNDGSFCGSVDSAVESTSNVSNSSSGSLLSPLRKMDFALCEVSTGGESPVQSNDSASTSDDENISEPKIMNESNLAVGDSDAKVLTLAEHIIAAMPERIKNESEEIMLLGSPMSDPINTDSSAIGGLNTFMEPLLDSLPNPQFDHEFNFEFSDHSYRYHDAGTPCSSLSPASSGPLQSPASYTIQLDPPMCSSPSPPPSAEELTEFLLASSNSQRPFESDFSNLALTDREQRELYEAAKCIQKAYRSYKGRKKLEEQDKERSAAIVIQNYYRRYKQFAYYRQMTHAALIIQNKYRSYCETKRFKATQNSGKSTENQNSHCLQKFYKNYQNDHHSQNNGGTTKEPSPSGPLKRTYSQRTQNQAARKIQQFMRQSKLNIWDDQMGILTSERTSRKREAGTSTQGGIPSKLAASRSKRSGNHTRSK